MISVDEAIAIIMREVSSLPHETICIENSVGRTLAVTPLARLTHPPARMSAMDGYAMRLDAPQPIGAQFEVRGEAPAGRPFEGELSGGAVRIFTGGVVPGGANHVVIQEDVERQGETITLTEEQTAPRHIRQKGTDFTAGDKLLSVGRVLKPIDIALLATAGISDISVVKKPSVAVFANGDELVEPNEIPGPGQVVNSITRGLKPLLESWGADVIDLGVARDHDDAVRTLFDRGAEADLLIPVGGASVGDYDVVKRVGRERYALQFEKVAVKPGKPVWFGTNDRKLILGLPGNPSSAFVCSFLFVRCAINRLLGRDEHALTLDRAHLAEPLGPNGNRESFLRAVVYHDEHGSLCTRVESRQDTALLSPFAASNALVRRAPGEAALEKGATVQVLCLTP
ncbi:MAG: molybdopterin molybdotransferase MoeA [Pseudomonadota bacterium]